MYSSSNVVTLTVKADLWSIGVILHEALFGRAPFCSDTLEKLVVKIKEDVPVVIPNNGNIRLVRENDYI